MKTILSAAALVLVLCGLPPRRQTRRQTRSVPGRATTPIGDQERTATLTITKDGDKLAGTMNWRTRRTRSSRT
jgi:hypothetical protein